MALQRFTVDSLPVTPWKNGGGGTCEIACWPPGAGLADFAWRLSIASIARSGPFSVFAGVNRCIMLLDGDGVHLMSVQSTDSTQTGQVDIDHRLDTSMQPFAFSGDNAVHCTLLGGPSRDFNVMTRRGEWHADVQVLSSSVSTQAAPHGMLLAVHGSWQLGAGHDPLQAGEGLVWTDESASWHIAPQLEPQLQPQSEAGARETQPRLLLVRLSRPSRPLPVSPGQL
jgi:environmental stress-induced protein Ves